MLGQFVSIKWSWSASYSVFNYNVLLGWERVAVFRKRYFLHGYVSLRSIVCQQIILSMIYIAKHTMYEFIWGNLITMGKVIKSGASNDIFGQNSVLGDFPSGWQFFQNRIDGKTLLCPPPPRTYTLVLHWQLNLLSTFRQKKHHCYTHGGGAN